jgi:hypothetical protein
MCCISCKQKKHAKHFESSKINTQPKAKTDATIKKTDSIFQNALKKALSIAKASKKENFRKNFSIGNENLNNKVDVELKFGNLFSRKYKNLLIVSSSKLYTKINVYAVRDTGFTQLIDKILMTDSHPGYLIEDVNNDGLKDLSINWYPLSGCCRRNIFDLYLSKNDETFSKEIELVNPTFFPKEKVIRGITYGHPGLASLYKFRWNGINVDTIEYIYPNINDTLHISFVKSNSQAYSRLRNKWSENLKSIPKEYNPVLDLDYFKSYNLKDIKVILKNIDK